MMAMSRFASKNHQIQKLTHRLVLAAGVVLFWCQVGVLNSSLTHTFQFHQQSLIPGSEILTELFGLSDKKTSNYEPHFLEAFNLCNQTSLEIISAPNDISDAPQAIVFLIDDSRTTSVDQLDTVTQCTNTVITLLSESDDMVSIVSSRTPTIIHPLTPLSHYAKPIKNQLKTLYPTGRNNYKEALKLSERILESAPNGCNKWIIGSKPRLPLRPHR